MGGERRVRTAVRTALLVLSVVAPLAAQAQASGAVFPPSVVITNYDRVLVGEQESLETGAFVARVGDTTAGWYNLAGTAKVERTAIGASASGFETDVLTLQGINKAGGSFAIRRWRWPSPLPFR